MTVGLVSLLLLTLLGVDPSPATDMFLVTMRSDQRVAAAQVPTLLESLTIKPGTTVLDLGAGAGLLTEGLAKAVGPQGKVIATEIDPVLVEELEKLKASRGLANVSVLQVQALGLDPAYTKARYDLVVLVGVYEFMFDPKAFFSALKPYLNPGARVVVVHPKVYPGLAEDRVIDLDAVRSAVGREGDDSPMLKVVSKQSVNSFIINNNMSTSGYQALVGELNSALADPAFTRAVMEYAVRHGNLGLDGLVREVGNNRQYLFRWLLNRFSGAFNKSKDQLSAYEKKGIWTINWIILEARYIGPEGVMDGYAIKDDPLQPPLEVKKDFESCGYRYQGQLNRLHFYDILQFGN
jgi:protein-L-isoaspartate O-methyltransferase